MNSIIFAKETLAVGTATTNLTASVYQPTNLTAIAHFVTLTVADEDIRYWLDGTNPTGGTGHLLIKNSVLQLEGYKRIKDFKCIRNVLATCNAIVSASYEKWIT